MISSLTNSNHSGLPGVAIFMSWDIEERAVYLIEDCLPMIGRLDSCIKGIDVDDVGLCASHLSMAITQSALLFSCREVQFFFGF